MCFTFSLTSLCLSGFSFVYTRGLYYEVQHSQTCFALPGLIRPEMPVRDKGYRDDCQFSSLTQVPSGSVWALIKKKRFWCIVWLQKIMNCEFIIRFFSFFDSVHTLFFQHDYNFQFQQHKTNLASRLVSNIETLISASPTVCMKIPVILQCILHFCNISDCFASLVNVMWIFIMLWILLGKESVQNLQFYVHCKVYSVGSSSDVKVKQYLL